MTRDRAKPAVPFGGKYRLIDFTLSNCINSGVRRVFVLTQYRAASLNRHLQEGWNISVPGLGDYIYTMPAQQKVGADWYRGTADAVRQNLDLVKGKDMRHVLILSGDHVYKMDYARMLSYHHKRDSCLTISVLNVPKKEAAGRLGVLEVGDSGYVIGFEEKPAEPRTRPDAPDYAFSSMGIYIFSISALMEALLEGGEDFGKEVIPSMIRKGRKISVYPYERENIIADSVLRLRRKRINRTRVKRTRDSSYWRDVGTLDSYFQASMDLLGHDPLFNLNTENWPFRTYQEPLPPSKCTLGGATCGSLISDGCVIEASKVDSSILSPGVIVQKNAIIENAVIFDRTIIGTGARVKNAVIDKQVIVQPGASLGYYPDSDVKKGCTVTEAGLVVVPKETTIEPD